MHADSHEGLFSPRPTGLVLGLLAGLLPGCGDEPVPTPTSTLPYATEPSLQAQGLAVRYEAALDAVVFEMRVAGDAGAVQPTPAGQVDGAPVLGYVFTTSLASTDVGFGAVEGTVALAVTSHPDFDDTPLWDEDQNGAYDDDGVVYHAHWVVLSEDERAPAGLAVLPRREGDVLPPTAPMDMYLDAPGFTVVEDGSAIRVVVPADRIGRKLDVEVGGATAYMQVDASGEPLLAVHGLVSQIDGVVPIADADTAPAASWPARTVATPTTTDVFEIDQRTSAAAMRW